MPTVSTGARCGCYTAKYPYRRGYLATSDFVSTLLDVSWPRITIRDMKITDAQFQAAQDKLDALARKTRRGTAGTAEENAAYKAAYDAWEAANALPQIKKVDRDRRDEALLAAALKHGLVTL